MKKIHSKLFYVSPLLLAAATGLLVLIIVIFAVVNIQREKKVMTHSMLQKASTLMRFIHSGGRGSYMTALKNNAWNPGPWEEHVQRIINHITEDPNVSFLAVINENGLVIAHSDKEYLGKTIDLPLNRINKIELSKGIAVAHQVVEKHNSRYFEAIGRYIPFKPAMAPMMMGHMRGIRRNLPFFAEKHLSEKPFLKELEKNVKGKYYVIAGLDMGDFDKSLVQLRVQIIILSVAMLLVGVGGWLSLITVQGYKVSQGTLAEVQAYIGYLISKLPVGIIGVDKKNRITTLNKVASSMTGLNSRETVGKYPIDVLPSELRDFFSTPKKIGLLNDDKVGGMEREIKMTIGNTEQVLFCQLIDILDGNSEYIGQVLMISNLTLLKKMESEMREHERLAAVGRMAAGVAHEVRNPLSSIKGLALLLQEKFVVSSKENETAALLIQEVERMNRTISELLSFARPHSLNLEAIDVKELMSEELYLICSDTQHSGIQTESLFSKDLNKVLADRDRLNQVFINILLNAVQAMDKGGKLTLEAYNNDTKEKVVVKISDTGVGIDEGTKDQVFFPYYTTKHGGTGIGLAISQKIISDHRGTIKIDSEIGKGTTVTVELPSYLN